ncbi:MAG: excinuclease ABC subunit UvrA [Oscillospiraceae bacterium]|nr:excinuclease ABC subunit UvrA [Oscillospiraceae bacterium]
MRDDIYISGARAHNLKNISLSIPRNKLIVFTGLSGCGKSSLAFDTIYAEGYRRFVESLSSYARQFLGQLDKPEVDYIEGLSPAISIDQKTTSRNPRSTVGTVTEIYDYLRLLYANIGIPHCPVCGKEIKGQTVDQIADKILSFPEGTRFQILAPVIKGKKGLHEKVLADAMADGYVRVRIDGFVYDLSETPVLDKNKKHAIEIVIDRLVINGDIFGRLSGSLETALALADGTVMIEFVDKAADDPDRIITLSQNFACEEHGFSMAELAPRMFSFNNPYGACEACGGLGLKRIISPRLVIPDLSLSLSEGAIQVNGFKSLDNDNWSGKTLTAVLEKYGLDLNSPLCDYSPDALNAILYGTGGERHTRSFIIEGQKRDFTYSFDGIINIIQQRFEQTNNEYYDAFLEDVECPVCKGKRLKKEILSVTVGGLSIADFTGLSITAALEFINKLTLTEKETMISREITKEIRNRLSFLQHVGLDYLTLSRRSATLSGGESQRIRLATQIGSSLMGVLYILDEPSIGLHQRDNSKLIDTLKRLRDIGNTVIVVEHDEETMENADYIVDIGPGAGIEGGNIVAAGTPQEVMNTPGSITGDFLSGRRKIKVPDIRRSGNGYFLKVLDARENNLKGIDISIPLGTFTSVTGVSGSGKSSLVNGILLQELASKLNRAYTRTGKCKAVLGLEALDKVIAIDQSPIGRTPRSNPATYTGLFNEIRAVFAKTPDAKARGYGQDRFSFNLRGGRCEACGGDGTIKIEMHFLPDVYVTCDVCKGKRYNRETLEVRYKGKTIADVLDMTITQASSFFENIPQISRKLKTMCDVGIGYIKLGQSSTTLSGGEAQRVKLSCELSKRSTGKTIYILDEPTTGLHSADVEKLIEVLNRFVDSGNTVLVIEHNLDIIKTSDYIIDLGPEGGDKGGTLVACGTPEQVAQNPGSYTGQYLRKVLIKTAIK